MKKFLLAMAVLCMGTMAFAGPNAGGTLIAHDANLTMLGTDGNVSICGQGSNLGVCEQADAQIDGSVSGAEAIMKVYAAFAVGSAPRLMGIAWGVYYDDTNLFITAFGKCGDFELNDDAWPGNASGSSVTWNTVQQGFLTPVYWFAAYNYAPVLLTLGPNPSQGGVFGDDTVPAILDPIHCYGAMGFDMAGSVCCPPPPGVIGACCDPATGACVLTEEGQCQPPRIWHPEWTACEPTNPCPQPPTYGACCDPNTGGCTLTIEADCLPPGIWHPEWTSCDPNPCPSTPTETRSWGQIKANYR